MENAEIASSVVLVDRYHMNKPGTQFSEDMMNWKFFAELPSELRVKKQSEIIIYTNAISALLLLSPFGYMKKFDPHYRDCSKLFESLIKKQVELSKQYIALADAYYAFLEFIQADKRFRSSEQVEEIIFGRGGHSLDSDTLITKENIPLREFEQFVYFSGSGHTWHKVVISFYFSQNVHLQYVWFFYHEEDYQKYFFELKRKKFPPDDNGKGKTKNTFRPQPGRGKKIPALQN